MASLKKAHASSGSSHSKSAKFKRYLPLYLMFLPGAIYLLINNYIPMAGIIVAFKKYNARLGIWKSPFCGLANFEFLFASSDAWTITRNTLLYNLAFIVLNTVVGIIFAIFICDTFNKKLKKIYQSAILFPYLMSAVILGYIVYAFLSQSTGIVNNSILSALGKDAVNWYAEPKYWPFILIFVNTWKGVGYGCLIYISTINGIDPSLYEAASLDGATKWQQIKPASISPSSDLSLSLPQTESYVKSAKKTQCSKEITYERKTIFQISDFSKRCHDYLDACHYLTVYSVIYVFYYR